jgi:hypothetical protein
MKDWITKHYPDKLDHDGLRGAVKAAWDAIPIEELEELVGTIHDHCDAVIKAEGDVIFLIDWLEPLARSDR